MRRNIGTVAQNLLRNEMQPSQDHSGNEVDGDSVTEIPKVGNKDRHNGKKQFNLVLPETLYQAVKQKAADEERSMNSFIVFAVKQALKNQG